MSNHEEMMRDFDQHLHDAWSAVNALYEFLAPLNRDGVIRFGIYDGQTERMLVRLVTTCDWLSNYRGNWNPRFNCGGLHSPCLAAPESESATAT
jgi:hypothetical protein